MFQDNESQIFKDKTPKTLQELDTIRTNDSVGKVLTPNKVDLAQNLEVAVCTLALAQEVEIQKHQEHEREFLKKAFEEQRQQFAEEFLKLVKAGPSRYPYICR